MGSINLKNDIWLEGFDTEYQYRQRLYGIKGINNSIKLICQSETSEISEELASQCCNYLTSYNGVVSYKQYDLQHEAYNFKTAKESIQSACSEENCIVYKK